MEILKKFPVVPVRAVLFDFDGTLSTLRFGWENVMKPLMLEMISGGKDWDEALEKEVDAYISESTGIQTIHQMKWLCERVRKEGKNPSASADPWWYKDEYNRRLMEQIQSRLAALENGKKRREDFIMAGSENFLRALKNQGVKIYVASGTDHPDVVKEAAALGLAPYFDQIAGAPLRSENCSKEKVMAQLMEAQGLRGDEVAVIGDGKVEIMLGDQAGARTVGLASDEGKRYGVNEVKKEKLLRAGAAAIAGAFLDLPAWLSFLGLKEPDRKSRTLDFTPTKTFSAATRINLVRIDNLKRPGEYTPRPWGNADFDLLTERIRAAKEKGKEIIFSMGAHVIKCGLSPYLIALMKKGFITHLSGNGACSIHDFELAYLGGTSEHVPTAIEDGSFGMWEETGGWMNEALREGAKDHLGYGEALGRYIDRHPERFPYREDCVLYQAYKLDIPVTYHIALGTDIIHQHPQADFALIGEMSGIDFHKICYSVAHLDQGVYMNFGSGVIGPEVFLKALSIARNQGYPTFDITTANFDLIDLGDYRCKIGYEDPQYYYRPRKNIVNRPVSRGGLGWHFCGDHQDTIPHLYEKLVKE